MKIYKDIELEFKALRKMVQNEESAIVSMDILTETTFTDILTKDVFNCVRIALKDGVKCDTVYLMKFLDSRGYAKDTISKFIGFDTFILKNACLRLKELEVLRKINVFSLELQNKLTDNADALNVTEFITEKATELNNLSTLEKERKLSDITDDVIAEMEEGLNGETNGIKTGLTELDDQTGVLKKGHLITIGGRPAMGKTTLALSMAHRVAKQGLRVVFCSLEMSDTPVALNFISAESNVGKWNIENGKVLSNDDILNVRKAKDSIDDLDLHILDLSSPTLEELTLKLKKIQIQKPIDLVVVDYLQLMSGKGDKYAVVTKNSEGLKSLAKELKCPFIQLAQLSRAVENKSDKRPDLSHLKDSGAIEQDSDKVVFVWRPDYYVDVPNEIDGIDLTGKVVTITAKNRQGKLGDRILNQEFKYGRFSNIEEDFTETTVDEFKEQVYQNPNPYKDEPPKLNDVPF